MTEITTGIRHEALDVAAALAAASSPDCGGIAAFVGTVRASAAAPGRQDAEVIRLDYEAHPTLADARLSEIAEEAAAKWDLRAVLALHRTGSCALGEPTVVVVCAAPHRSDALEACRFVIDTVKTTVPIWKRELYADGSAWIGAEGAAPEARS
jgi:molybdopterin synthase catalytic subunit